MDVREFSFFLVWVPCILLGTHCLMWLLWYLCAHGYTTVTVEIIDVFKSHRNINFTTRGSVHNSYKRKNKHKIIKHNTYKHTVYKINVYKEFKVHENYFVSSSWQTWVWPSTVAMSYAVFPSCMLYDMNRTISGWVLWRQLYTGKLPGRCLKNNYGYYKL